MALIYVDASAAVKLIQSEPESGELGKFVAGAELVSCALVLAEIPRAVRRAALNLPAQSLDKLMRTAQHVIDNLAIVPIDNALLQVAGAIEEPTLRTLDAIHLAACASVAPVDAFVSYDQRRLEVAQRAGLPVESPGA